MAIELDQDEKNEKIVAVYLKRTHPGVSQTYSAGASGVQKITIEDHAVMGPAIVAHFQAGNGTTRIIEIAPMSQVARIRMVLGNE